jgi:hypothetical protein
MDGRLQAARPAGGSGAAGGGDGGAARPPRTTDGKADQFDARASWPRISPPGNNVVCTFT